MHVSHRGEVFQHGSPSARAKWRSLLRQRSAEVAVVAAAASDRGKADENQLEVRQARVYGEFSLCGGLGSWSGPAFCPGLSARTDCEGVIGGVRGFPPVSIGTESHRGSDGGGARTLVPAPFLYAPPADPRRTERCLGGGGRDPHVRKLCGVSLLIVNTTKNRNVFRVKEKRTLRQLKVYWVVLPVWSDGNRSAPLHQLGLIKCVKKNQKLLPLNKMK